MAVLVVVLVVVVADLRQEVVVVVSPREGVLVSVVVSPHEGLPVGVASHLAAVVDFHHGVVVVFSCVCVFM